MASDMKLARAVVVRGTRVGRLFDPCFAGNFLIPLNFRHERNGFEPHNFRPGAFSVSRGHLVVHAYISQESGEGAPFTPVQPTQAVSSRHQANLKSPITI